MPHRPHHRRQSRASAAWASVLGCVLALVLLVAPTLGRMHQVVHAPGLLGQVAHGVGGSGNRAGEPAAAGRTAGHVLDTPHALFAGHAGSDCQLLDQQLLGGVLLAAGLPLAHAPPAAPPAAPLAAGGDVQRLPVFLARAPPVPG